MAIFSRVKTWVSNEVLTASDLNAEFNNLLTNTKPQSIEDYSTNVTEMQATTDPGGVGTESLATSTAGEFERYRFVMKRLVGAQWYVDPGRYLTAGNLGVQTADIAAGAVTTAKIADLNVTTAKIADSNVTTAKIADANVTIPKLGTSSYSEAIFGSGSFTTSSTSLVDITNLSLSYTTRGRPIRIFLKPESTGGSFLRVESSSSNLANATVYLLMDGSTLAQFPISTQNAASAGSFTGMSIPSSSISTTLSNLLTPGAYAFKFQVICTSGTNFSAIGCKIAIQEGL